VRVLTTLNFFLLLLINGHLNNTLNFSLFIFSLPKLTNISPPKQIILHQNMPHRTIIYLTVQNNLPHAFPLNHVLINDSDTFRSINYLRTAHIPCLSIAEYSLPIILIIGAFLLYGSLPNFFTRLLYLFIDSLASNARNLHFTFLFFFHS